jgi:thioredoxin 1
MFIKKIVCTTLLLSVAQSAFAHKKIIPLTVTYDNYKAVVLQAKLPVILDLYSPWCGPCQKLMAIFEELAEELHGSYIFARLNVDEEPMLATELGVATVPTLI